MNIPTMGAIIPALARNHRVYALEFQGHGRTTDINRPITYPKLADDEAVITQVDKLMGYIEPFLKDETPKGFFQ